MVRDSTLCSHTLHRVRVSQDQSFGIGASANRAFQFDLRTGKTENVFEAGPSLVNCVCIATEQTEFASVNDCGVLKIWDLRTGYV